MKKIFIGLLLTAVAATGIYFLFFSKKKTEPTTDDKEFVIGKWKPFANQPVIDTTAPSYQYNFQKEGILFRSINDTTKADTLQYSWNKTGDLVIKKNNTDTVADTYNIILLNADTLQLKKANADYIINLQRAK